MVQKTCFSKEGSRGGQHEFENYGFRASEFHGALRERVLSFDGRSSKRNAVEPFDLFGQDPSETLN